MNTERDSGSSAENKRIHVNEPIAEEPHEHEHVHNHEHTQAVIHRLSRAIGHLESVRKMVAEERDCSEVLIQLAAVRGTLNAISRIILKNTQMWSALSHNC